jgi:hypothetical protein
MDSLVATVEQETALVRAGKLKERPLSKRQGRARAPHATDTTQ